MTIESWDTVQALLAEDPYIARVYWYQRHDSFRSYFAVFAHASDDDMAHAPEVADYTCLYRDGAWTAAGCTALKMWK